MPWGQLIKISRNMLSCPQMNMSKTFATTRYVPGYLPHGHTIHNVNKPTIQKILSTEYVSFGLFGLCFTYVTGVLIILVSYILEPIYACLYRRNKYGEYTYLEWTTTETLQLQRTSYQGIGSGTWLGQTEAIPRTTTGEKLANLPLSYSIPGGDSINRNNLHPSVAQLLESESSLVGTDSSKSTISKIPAPSDRRT